MARMEKTRLNREALQEFDVAFDAGAAQKTWLLALRWLFTKQRPQLIAPMALIVGAARCDEDSHASLNDQKAKANVRSGAARNQIKGHGTLLWSGPTV